MSDSTSLRLAIIKETDWGKEAIPTSINKAQEVRLSSESFGLRRDTQVSDEIRSDRNISELYQTLSYADGDINAEFSAKSHDQLIEGVMYKDFASDGDLVDVSGIAASNVITVGSPDVTKFKIDDVVEITGFYKDAVNRNGLYEVTAKPAANTITVKKYGATVNLPTLIAVNKNTFGGEILKRYNVSGTYATTGNGRLLPHRLIDGLKNSVQTPTRFNNQSRIMVLLQQITASGKQNKMPHLH